MEICERDVDFSKVGVARRLVLGWRLVLGLVLLFCMLGVGEFILAPASVTALGNQGQCPNEDLRAELNSMALPDCRAYELVTPPYKEGYPLFVLRFASNGEKAILYSLASLVENPGSSEVQIVSGIYSATRTNIGWQLVALNPPLSQFVGQLPVLEAEEADRGETLWEQHEPDQPPSSIGLYARSSAGDYSFIGSLAPHENKAEEPSDVIQGAGPFVDQPVAATDNYGKVILESSYSGGRWPADKTVGQETHSLYEYAGTDNKEPSLVAVEGGHGSTQLIGACGSTLGAGVAGPSLDSYNALSSDGEKIFFTVAPISEEKCSQASAPPTAEIYERVSGSLGSAKTVHVSVDECTVECGEVAPGKKTESGKNFEGASEDGSRVFFTSSQKLTNDAINGTASGNAAEGKGCAGMVARSPEGGCNLYEYVHGHLTLVAGGEVLGVMDVAEDGSRVYFAKRTEEKQGEETVEHDNVYLYETANQKIIYVATLSNKDKEDWLREAGRRPVELAGTSGQFLLFASSTPGVTPDDTSSVTQLFEYKAESGGEPAELVRVTQGEAGYNQNGNAVDTGVSSIATIAEELVGRYDFKSTTNRLNISTDGHTIVFVTSGELSPRGTSSSQGCDDLYEFHSDGDLATGRVSLLSIGQSTQLYKGTICGAQFQGMDAAGGNVLFTTVDSLVADDVDGQRDIYDARVDGGFPGMSSAGGVCAGVMFCEGSSSSPIVSSAAASNGGQGEAPLAVSGKSKGTTAKPKHRVSRCRRGLVRMRGKCLRHSKGKKSSEGGHA